MKAQSPLSSMLITQVGDGPSIQMLVPWIGVHDLYHLSRLNTNFYQQLMKEQESKRCWIDVAVSITSYPSKGFNPTAIKNDLEKASLQNDAGFFYKLRALLCPWTSLTMELPLSILFRTIPQPTYMLLTDNDQRMVLQTDEPEDTAQSSFPAVFDSEAFAKSVVLMEERVQFPAEEMDHTAEVQRMTPRGHGMPDFRRDLMHRYLVVHGGVFAVMEFHDISGVGAKEGMNGIYFFASRSGRMLCHLVLEGLDERDGCFLQSRPWNMWILGRRRVTHFYTPPIDSDQYILTWKGNLSSAAERMDPALWMAAKGEVRKAIQFMQRCFGEDEGIPVSSTVLNKAANFNQRTLLHYAAEAGNLQACRWLLDSKAKPGITDRIEMTPITLAIRKLHLDVAKLLIAERGEMQVGEFSKAWWTLCKQDVKSIPRDDDSIRRQTRQIVPGLLRELLFECMPSQVGVGFVVHDHFKRALQSSCILASKDSVALILRSGGVEFQGYCKTRLDLMHQIFCSVYRTKTHEEEAFETVKMLFTEFEYDVNRNICPRPSAEEPLVLAVKFGNLDLVRFMVEEMGANIRVRSRYTKEGLRAVCRDRAVIRMCGESISIRDYLDALFAREGAAIQRMGH